MLINVGCITSMFGKQNTVIAPSLNYSSPDPFRSQGGRHLENTLVWTGPSLIRVHTRISAAAFILVLRFTSAALIRGRRLFKNCTGQIYFFYMFIQRYSFYLLMFLWTDTKLCSK